MGKILAQIVDRESRDATIKPVKGFSGVETIQTVYERYKIWIPSQMDANIPVEQLEWARKKTMNSGLGGFQSFEPVVPAGSFVIIEEDDNGDWVIGEVLPNVVCDEISSEFVPGKASSGFPPTYYQGLQKVPTTAQTSDGGGLVCELPQTPQASLEDEKQNKHNKTETIYTACKKVDFDAANEEIEKLIKDVEDLRTGLLGEDSFLATSQEFVNQVQDKVNSASAKITELTADLVQEIRKYVLRKVNAGINDLTGNAPLSTRYIVNEAKDGALSTISCLFANILANLENLIYDLLSQLIDYVLNTSTCLIENFISNFIGQIVAQLTELINIILEPISSLLGSVISFTSEILDFVISILDFLLCKEENLCPQIEKYNPLDGPVVSGGSLTLDINSIFESAKGVADSFQGIIDIPENIEDYEFVFDAQAALDATLDSCNVGFEECGVPSVVFWGGSGSGATGNAVVNAVGDIIGVDLVLPGDYEQAPIIDFEDNCGNGVGAEAIPVLGDNIVVEVAEDTEEQPITRHEIRFDEDGEISICDATDVEIIIAGAAGADGLNGNLGNAGRVGTLPYALGETITSRTLKIQVGKKGIGSSGGRSSYAQGGNGSNGGGGGGGATAVYDEALGRYTIVAAGGGGGAAAGGGESSGIAVGLGFGRVRDAMSSDSSSPLPGKNASNGGGGGGGGSQPSNEPGNGDGGNGRDGNGGASGFDTRVAEFSYDGYSNVGDGYVVVSFTGRICEEKQTTTKTVRPVTGVVITNPGYGYLPSPNGSKGGMGRVWADRCQTVVRRANRSWDAPYSEGNVIRLYYGDRITLPGQSEVVIDCDFNAIELPGCIETGEKYCYKDMRGFDDGSSGGTSLENFNIKSMVGFDDIRGSNPRVTPPVSIEHQKLWEEVAQSERAQELLEEDRKEIEAAGVPHFGRPDQFGFLNDYPYARELGFSDSDIRYYLEGFYSKLLGKRLGPLMRVKLEDPTFGPLPKRLSGAGGAGVFDCETDYPYALSLGFNDKDIRYYLENVYRGKIDECMQRKLNDANFGRVNYYVELTAPGCPPDQLVGDYEVISEIGDVYIDDGGFGYQPGDTATVLDCSGNPDSSAKVEITVDQRGVITSAKVINPGANYTCIPEIIINTGTGYNARLIPVLKFTRAEDVPPGTQVLQVIDCVGRV